MKKSEFRLKSAVESILNEIRTAKINSEAIHAAKNIRGSGDEVEETIRNKIELFLPERYLVKQGHLVDSNGNVSNQLDIIVFDRLNTPKFFESKDNTIFYPIESVLAIGEIKKTLKSTDLIQFSEKIKKIKTEMNRELIPNTIYNGKISASTQLSDIVFMKKGRKYRNSLFSFVIAIDAENFDEIEITSNNKFTPNDLYVLNKGLFFNGYQKEQSFVKCIEDEVDDYSNWVKIDCSDLICLSTLLYNLVDHLNESYIEPYSLAKYISGDKDSFQIKGSNVKCLKNIRAT